MFCSHQVDEQMRQELAEWKLSVDKDKGGKTKANAKVPHWETAAAVYAESFKRVPDCICFILQKKKGSKSGKKKKKEKDLTADRWGHAEPDWIFSTMQKRFRVHRLFTSVGLWSLCVRSWWSRAYWNRHIMFSCRISWVRHYILFVTEILLSDYNSGRLVFKWCAGTPQEVHNWAVLSRNYGVWMCCPLLVYDFQSPVNQAHVAKTNRI